MIFDALRRRGNPTNAWDRVADLSLTVELLSPAVNTVAIESRLDQLEFLGRSSSAFHSPLLFADLGLVIDNEPDGTFSGFSTAVDRPSKPNASTSAPRSSPVARHAATRQTHRPLPADPRRNG